MHWNLLPINTGDTPEVGPVWKLPKEEMFDKKNILASEELETMKDALKHELKHELKRLLNH